MKKFVLTISCALIFCTVSKSQTTFWTEDFNNSCTALCSANGYTSTNGTWTVSMPGTNGNVANEFFISCAENGEPVGSCGASCSNNATLHIANVSCSLCLVCPSGDCGAAYNAGPTFAGEDPTTDIRCISPDINTTGKTNITLAFKYIEKGQGTTDDATVDYSINGGTTWTLLTNPSKTSTCGSGQGLWTAFTYVLPSSCENILNLKLGFHWKNNSDGVGTDPSFAVDDVTLSAPTIQVPVVAFSSSDTIFCEKHCIDFTDLSTNAPTSWQWNFTGATPDTSSLQNPTQICYNSYGTFSVSLTATNAGGTDSATYSGFITVYPNPLNPSITQSGDTLTSSPAYAYQWYNGVNPITGATSQTYITALPGIYYVVIADSNNCTAASNSIIITGISKILTENDFITIYNMDKENLVISFRKNFKTVLADVIDMSGRVVANGVLNNSKEKSLEINLYSVSSGMYVVKIRCDGKITQQKFFKN